MHLRLALLAVGVCAAAYGCAAPEQKTAAPSAAPSAATAEPPARYVTGSRLPVREDDRGSSSVSAASKEAYQDDMMQRMNTGTSGK